jgi:predicted ATPase
VRSGRSWDVISQQNSDFESIFNQAADPAKAPEILTLQDEIKRWRFYDHFRSDADAPARLPQLGTRTPVLHHDGRDLAAALQTIIEIGDAFPGAALSIDIQADGRFNVNLKQEGRLIIRAANSTQVWVVSHASRLIAILEADAECNSIHLHKELGQTQVLGQSLLDQPAWHWPDKSR